MSMHVVSTHPRPRKPSSVVRNPRRVSDDPLSQTYTSPGPPYPDAIPARYGAVVLAFVLGFVAAVVLVVTVCPTDDSPVITQGVGAVSHPYCAAP